MNQDLGNALFVEWWNLQLEKNKLIFLLASLRPRLDSVNDKLKHINPLARMFLNDDETEHGEKYDSPRP